MGKKKSNSNNQTSEHDHDHNNEGEKKEVVQKKEGDDGGGKEGGKHPPTVILKIEMHCEGCVSKIIKLARGLDGVQSVKADTESSKLTVIGIIDPSQIREILHQKTKKKVELLSPQPKKEDSNAKNNKGDNKKSSDKKPDAENKKPKEAPVTSAVIKVAFHCLGCIEKIHRIVSKTKGVHEMTLDKQKETVTVKGTMDVKALTETLKDRLKRPVEIVPPKKEKDGGGGGGDKDGENTSGKKKNKGGGDGQDKAAAGGGGGGGAAAKVEGNKIEYMMQPGFGYGPGPGFGYVGQPQPQPQQPVHVYGSGYMGQAMQPMPVYGNGYMAQPQPVPMYEYGYGQVPGYPVHMKFNDENPNACSVM
ncbi:heavy metal-associated isoprenylated plant protein 3 [Manihot esculenta]|uniref:HMA domain-containing protein n=1 Tax=Manihot esculenta TaxID=3983 RepID=A0A2C9W143_MANES|nr:heavy metal-associated isoprenylated plant protein 3 [Manihot esculenta]OAY51543.1 hypothetical protein MANES_04G015400v8 [Manihot esculenta]